MCWQLEKEELFLLFQSLWISAKCLSRKSNVNFPVGRQEKKERKSLNKSILNILCLFIWRSIHAVSMDYTQWNPGNHDMKRNNIPSRDKQSKKTVVFNEHRVRVHDLQQPKPHRQDTEVQGQNTSGFDSTGEPSSSPCSRGRGARQRGQREESRG